MKTVLVIEMPNEYADRYNVNEMYVWGLTIQDKHGYAMFDLVTDKPNHLRPLPEKMKHEEEIDYDYGYIDGRNECIDEITGETE